MRNAIEYKDNFEKSVSIIECHEGLADFENGATEEDVRLAEDLLKIKFPSSYKKFLIKFGVGDFNGREFYGIVPGHVPGESAPSAIWFTISERQENGLPNSMVVVASTGYGGLYCLDTSESSGGKAPVWIWDKRKIEKVAEDFSDFLLEEITQSMLI